MKALTVWNPWAWAIARGLKPIENRTWKPPTPLLGEWIAIHAGKKLDRDPDSIASWRAMVEATEGRARPPLPKTVSLGEMPASAIVAVARLVGVVEQSDDPWFVGPFGWVLEDVVAIEPVKCSGALGLWEVPADVLLWVQAHFRTAKGDA